MKAATLVLLDSIDASLRLPESKRRTVLREGRWLAGVIRSDARLAVRDVEGGGSIAKGTATHATDDLDLYIHVDLERPCWRVAGQSPRPDALLDLLAERLAALLAIPIARGRVSLRRQGHSVRVAMVDGVAFDIVPIVGRRGAACFELPERATGRWVSTSLRRQQQLFDESKGRFDGLVGGIRLLKSWRDEYLPVGDGVRWSSYALEVVALNACHARGRGIRPGQVFCDVLDWLVEGGLNGAAALRRWQTPRVAAIRGPSVRDPAWLANELMPADRAAARSALIGAAESTLSQLSRPEIKADKLFGGCALRPQRSSLS